MKSLRGKKKREHFSLPSAPPDWAEWVWRREVARELGLHMPDDSWPAKAAGGAVMNSTPMVVVGPKAYEGYRSIVVSWAPGALRQQVLGEVERWLNLNVPAANKQKARGHRNKVNYVKRLRDLLALRYSDADKLSDAEKARRIRRQLAPFAGKNLAKLTRELSSNLKRAAERARKHIATEQQLGAFAVVAAEHISDLAEDLPFEEQGRAHDSNTIARNHGGW